MDRLVERRCRPCEGAATPLTREAARALLAQLTDWRLDPEAHAIQREFRFEDYYRTMAFVNAVAWLAHREDHHPDMRIGYGRCTIRYSTHAIGGLSENDFICAAKVDALLAGN